MSKRAVRKILLGFLILGMIGPQTVKFLDWKWRSLSDEAQQTYSEMQWILLYKNLQQSAGGKDISGDPLLSTRKNPAPIDISRFDEYEKRYKELDDKQNFYVKLYNRVSKTFNFGNASLIGYVPFLFFMIAFHVNQRRNNSWTPNTYGFVISAFVCMVIWLKELLFPLHCSGYGCVGLLFIPLFVLVLGLFIIGFTHLYFRLFIKSKATSEEDGTATKLE